ncbi:MAG: shikimate dehydrogenase [Deltaproteobacteria bacterium]|uniref:Shikimate dehydrogenase (NADP(+)) n=1 Tax=Candidatus Zymogenus saltonus TaxID=2844893 RepID=A0A9D8KFB1_9DELT|nr:shikimate dehydrogenase [Candidatus Zymogenus saltonus]
MKREISPATKLFCLIGDPVSHSKSPAMMNAAFETLGIDAVYLAFHVQGRDVGTVLNALRIMDVGGVNVTAPHKGRVIGYLDELFPEAQLTGSVNTIFPSMDKLIGDNTDGYGMVSAINYELNVAVSGARILIIGAGGAARGVLFSILQESPASLTIANRSIDKAEELRSNLMDVLKRNIEIEVVPLNPGVINPEIDRFDIIINATSVKKSTPEATSPENDPLGLDLLKMKKGALFFDMNYGVEKGDVEAALKERGVLYSDGLAMLLHQGARALALWTGEEAPLDIMRAALGMKQV